tara:strand:- start:85510 stop:86286 length:777 start_codon:yes stop_codon:yes gene_type:complete
MLPRAVPLFLSLSLASCASANGDAGPDGGRFDARERADAGTGDAAGPLGAADAAPGATADAGDTTPDAGILTEALLITEIVDADLAGGLPKFVELTNLGSASVDLSEFSLGVFSNGSFTINTGSSTSLSGSLAPSASFVVSFETGDSVGSSSFRTVYGFDADDLSFGAVINGDDAVVLFRGAATGTGADATIIDIYGVIGTDGTGEVWEYLDGFASRAAGATTPSATFVPTAWSFSGASALDGEDATAIAAATSPGTH